MTEQEYLKHIKSSIAEIKSIDFRKNWAYEKVVHAILKIQKLPIILFIYPKENLIFRSRINNGAVLFDSKSKISAPKEEFVQNYARANKPKQTLFYGSENRPTSYLEFAQHLVNKTSFGDEILITIGSWRLKRDLTLILIFNPSAPRTTAYNKYHGKPFDQFINQIPVELRKGTIRFFEFIGNEYSKQTNGDNSTYLITCAYSNIVFAYEKSDGIIYPSVSSGGDGFNFALKKEISSENHICLEMAKVDKFVTKRQKNGKHSFDNIASMDASKLLYDTIEWNNSWQQKI